MRTSPGNHALLIYGFVSLIGLFPVLVLGQGSVLEEIIVTAQKREQSLQDVPISVAVTSGESIEKQSLTDLGELAAQTPNIIITDAPASDQLYIRGVGSSINGGFEQSVGTFVDGIYHGRSRYSRGLLFDVERVELLRGPQSTYFGNNAIAGALNVITRKPGDEFEGYVNLLFEPDDGERSVELALGGPVSDTFGVRVAAKIYGMSGFVRDFHTGVQGPDLDDKQIRATATWKPTDSFDATFKAEIANSDGDRNPPFQLFNCPPGPPFPGPGGGCAVALRVFGPLNDELDTIAADTPGEFTAAHTREYVLTLNLDMWDHTFTSVTGYSNYDYRQGFDGDSVPLPLLGVNFNEDFEQYSQEFRITSPTGNRFEYIAGFYWQSSDLFNQNKIYADIVSPLLLGSPVGPLYAPFLPVGPQNDLYQDEETFSLFGSLTWHATDSLRGTVGLRWTDVQKDGVKSLFIGSTNGAAAASGPFTPLPLPLSRFPLPPRGPVAGGLGTPHGPVPLSISNDDVTPSVNIQYDVTEDIMTYFSFSQGFKSGGFDAQNVSGPPAPLTFGPEEVDAYEAGAKATWLDGRLATNLTWYRNEYTDLQQAVLQTGITFNVENVGKLVVQGVEFDASLKVTENLTVDAAVAYLDSEYKSYPDGGCTALQSLQFAMANPGQTCLQDLTGQPSPYSPEFSGYVHARHVLPLPRDLRLVTDINVYFADDFEIISDNDPLVTQDSYAKLDARIALGNQGDTWEIAMVGKNLTDKYTRSFANDSPLAAGTFQMLLNRPRSLAIQGRYSW
ncbi:MAG: TonB-dependent receptor [Gammaproteobacteria bacterium]|nr:TonB-dependent receptor [Gammaproteobacteria bacterium]